MNEITLILKRRQNDLWIDDNEGHFGVIDNVTGLRLFDDEDANQVVVLHKGKKIGMIWNVVEIEEEW